ncbi:2-C-methyl-D-erythritol 2,4-cyclodiphosphate synthase [Myxococcaceae bacterium]|jgi:2-C-methyl-D-erythritol 2,4-cyclodiphosphate synthase|nr:2-C-methyl-D-erythritol 2,4-cyclodiphosphate synthase [Myxococcaceae bacterium]
MRVGQGFDAHRLVGGRPLRLGGVGIPHGRGLEGHSDGDVLLHAIASALLGAIGAGDLGRHWPSTDASLEGVSSGQIVAETVAKVRSAGFVIANVDATVIAQEPRLAPHLERMQGRIAELLGVDANCVNVKATSTDGLGTIGRGEGIAAQAVALVAHRNAP